MKALIQTLILTVVISFQYSYSQPSGWMQQNSGTAETLYSTHFENTLTGYAAGSNGKIIKTTNGGGTWFSLTSGINTHLRSIYFTSVSTGWAAGDGGKILKTTNDGSSWTQKLSGVTVKLNTICFFDSNIGLAAGENGTIIRTTNGGEIWTAVNSNITSNINSIYTASPTNCWAVGETGKILKSLNAGASWITNVDLGPTCNLYSVHFPNSQTGYIAGSYIAYGQQFVFIYNTVTAGEWWYYQYGGLNNIMRSVYFINTSTGIAAGDSGRIIGTTNGGANWYQQFSFKVNNLYSISFAGNKNGWISGSDGLILNTVNGGSFDTLNTNRRDIGVLPLVKNASLLRDAKYRIIFRTPDTSYNILRSFNNGVSFDTLLSHVILADTGREADGMIIRVNRIKSNIGVIKDPTRSIDSIETRLYGWEYSPVQNCNLEGSKYLHGGQSRPWQSKSMSLSYPSTGTYTNISSKLKPYELRKVKIVFTGYGTGQMAYRYLANTPGNYYVYQDMKQVPFKVYEVDGTDATPAPRQLNCAFLEFPADQGGTPDGKWEPAADSLGGKDILYIFGSNYSSNADTAYTQKNLIITSLIDVMYVWSAKLKSTGSIYNMNDEFYIYPYTVTRPEIDPGYPLYYEFETHTPVDVQNITTEIPRSYSLMQNYPNPFNPSTKIKFEVTNSLFEGGRGDDLVKLVIYDILGKEIVTLVNESLTPGTYEVEWNASNFSSGVYFYQLQVNNYSETKRMVLLK
ncbi:MAG: T9SS C-terminal target domain-containing protein [Ignavibacteriae bacterium]|nr:MAG: T9SS C-terminal target domain-containing protein [Ignavibacteriota bacterium]